MQTEKIIAKDVEYHITATMSPGSDSIDPAPPLKDPLWRIRDKALTDFAIFCYQNDDSVLQLFHMKGIQLDKDGVDVHRLVTESGKHKTDGQYVRFELIDTSNQTILLSHNCQPLVVLRDQKLQVSFGFHFISTAQVQGPAGGISVSAKVETY